MNETITWIIENLKDKTILLLNGEIGAGKTTLVHQLCLKLNYSMASSPTYAIHQKYITPSIHIDHVDLYRIQSEDELESSGFWDLFAEENTRDNRANEERSSVKRLVIIEWSEKIPFELWPMDWQILKLNIGFVDDPSGNRTRQYILNKLN